MSKCTVRNKDFLKSLNVCKKRDIDVILAKATKDQLDSITEIARNTLKGRIPYTQSSLKKLKRHKNTIREIAKKSISLKKKKQILKQKGGFLPFLIGPVLASVLSGVISNVIDHAI